jgi:hypothetical protein
MPVRTPKSALAGGAITPKIGGSITAESDSRNLTAEKSTERASGIKAGFVVMKQRATIENLP